MEQETSSQEVESHERPNPVSLRFVLCVLLGLYLAGYLAFRLKREPYAHVYYGDTFAEHARSLRWLWESDHEVLYKSFMTLYWPCMVGEDWLIRKVFM